MSKGTSGGLPWSGWPWDRARAARQSRQTGNRTASRSLERLALLAVVCLAISCQRPQTAYRHAVAAYQRGDSAATLKEAEAGAARWNEQASPWRWNFALLEAEALTTLGRYPDADAILKQEPPPRPELRQLRARLLVDRANLKGARHEDPSDVLV